MDVEHLIEMIPMQACVCDDDGNVVAGNSHWRAVSAGAAVNGPNLILDLISPADRAKLKSVLANLGADSPLQSNRVVLNTLRTSTIGNQSFSPAEWVLQSDRTFANSVRRNRGPVDRHGFCRR